MKKISLLTSLFILAFTASIFGQKANYDLAERFSPKKIDRMVHSISITPNWFENSSKFWYSWEDTNGKKYFVVDPTTRNKKELFNLEKLAMQLTEIVKDPYDAQHIPIANLRLKNDNIFTFEISSKLKGKKTFYFEYDITSMKLYDVTDKGAEKEFPKWASISPDSSCVVYSKGYNLYYTDMNNLRKIMKDEKDSTIVEYQLTNDGSQDTPWATEGYRETNTDNSSKRVKAYLYWSPDSKYFAINKYDMTNIKELWVINSTSSPRPTLESFRYQMPGEPSPKEYLAIFNMVDKTHKYVNADAYKDQSIDINSKTYTNKDRFVKHHPSIWLGGNDYFYITRLSRDLTRVDICKVEVSGNRVETIIEERLNTYIETRSLVMINSGKELIQWSERSGWGQLYLYESNGSLKNAITNGAYHVDRIVNVDEKNRVLYFIAQGVNKNENPYYSHLYRVNLDGSNLMLLNSGNYENISYLSDDTKYFVNNSSRVDTTPTSALYDNSGKKIMELETADFSQLLSCGYKFPETYVAKAADGVTDLHGVMYKPFDFDSTKVYPIIEYVYPGPQTEEVNLYWSKSKMDRIDRLAQIGFIVVTVGNRGGHPDRSKWYHNFGYGNLRDYGLEDKKVVVQQLASRYNWIDINRVGIHGHSGGGFMSTAALLKYPDFYKVAVSCAGNHDNSIYSRWWSETHHGIEELVGEKGDTTFKFSIDVNQELVKNLKGHLLLIHGDIDNNVNPANTIRMVDALIKANKRFEMLILPGQRHGFGNMTEYFFWRMADFYSRYLLDDYQNCVDISQMNND